jgi:ribosomal protein L40E
MAQFCDFASASYRVLKLESGINIMFCPKCGTQNPVTGKFCRSCGTDLATVSDALSGTSNGKMQNVKAVEAD